MPSIDEVLNGIEETIKDHFETNLGKDGSVDIDKVKESIKKAFAAIKQCIGYKRTDLPLKEAQDDENGFSSDSNFCNPYGKITSLILYLMSMELGSPPLYTIFNKANREMDTEKLNNLGPLARALGKILINAEIYRKDNDKYESGYKNNKDYDQNMAGAFIAFKGGVLQSSWLREWEANCKE